jgi:hypothetical protein
MQMLTRLEGNYALSRLTDDIAILRTANLSIGIDPAHYLPLDLKISSKEIQITSKNFKIKKVLKR